MKKKQPDVVFRRIRGRIVPIRRKGGLSRSQRKKKALIGAGALLGAAAVAIGGGFAAGRLLKAAAKAGARVQANTRGAQLSFDFAHGGTTVGKRVQEMFLKGAARENKKFARRIAMSQGALKLGTGVFAGALAGQGLERLGAAAKGEELNIGEETLTNVGGFVATEAATRSFTKGAGRKLITKILSRGRL